MVKLALATKRCFDVAYVLHIAFSCVKIRSMKAVRKLPITAGHKRNLVVLEKVDQTGYGTQFTPPPPADRNLLRVKQQQITFIADVHLVSREQT